MALLVKLLESLEVKCVLLKIKLVDHHLVKEELELLLKAIATSLMFTIHELLDFVTEAVQ
jgi:hypothetical protein